MPLDESTLDAIQARADAATLAPWTVDVRKGDETKAMIYRRYEFFGPQTEIVTLDIEADDAEFIAHAREDVPAMVAKLRELLALVDPIIERIDPDQIGTHSDRCHEYHVDCLALAVRARIAGLT